LRRVLLLAALAALLSGCHSGGLHRKGERMWSVHAQASDPIVGNFLWWDGKSDAPNAGIGVAHRWFLADRWAYSVGLTPTWFDDDGNEVWGMEFETGFRWYFAETGKFALFWDFNGGFLLTEDPVPARATDWNFTFALGPGAEWKLGEKWSLLGGVQLHHFSNGKGLNVAANPAQNETRVWLGMGWLW
jgi:hypothetical protein